MTNREKDMIIFISNLFIDELNMLKDNRTTINDVIEKVKNMKHHIENIDTRGDYDVE